MFPACAHAKTELKLDHEPWNIWTLFTLNSNKTVSKNTLTERCHLFSLSLQTCLNQIYTEIQVYILFLDSASEQTAIGSKIPKHN